jgi:hypothetical protein
MADFANGVVWAGESGRQWLYVYSSTRVRTRPHQHLKNTHTCARAGKGPHRPTF